MKVIIPSYALIQVLYALETCGLDNVPLTVEDGKLTIDLSHDVLVRKGLLKSVKEAVEKEQNTPKDGIR